MATINTTSLSQVGIISPSMTTLTASDVLTYTPGVGAILVLYNATAGALTPTIDGSGGTVVDVPGTGTTFSVAAGLVFPSIPAGEYRVVRLDTISAYLQGTVAVTGGTGIKAIIIQ